MAEFAGNAGKIHYRDWTPAEPRVLAVFFHGLGEHIGSYEPFAAALNDAGVALWAHDHAGHGRSDGVRVLIKDVDDLLDDASILLDHARSAHPGLPLVLIGHSLGSTVATLLTGERLIPAGTPPRKLVLTGSSLVPSADSGLVALLSTGMDPLDLRKDPGEMTRDTAYADQIRNDPLTWQGGLRLETLQALGIAAGRVSTVLPALDLPSCSSTAPRTTSLPSPAPNRPPESCRTPRPRSSPTTCTTFSTRSTAPTSTAR